MWSNIPVNIKVYVAIKDGEENYLIKQMLFVKQNRSFKNFQQQKQNLLFASQTMYNNNNFVVIVLSVFV